VPVPAPVRANVLKYVAIRNRASLVTVWLDSRNMMLLDGARSVQPKTGEEGFDPLEQRFTQ
jgi:hypothetical protein